MHRSVRRFFALLLAATLACGGFVPATALTGSCTISGQLKVDGTKRYICAKSGTKLRWAVDTTFKRNAVPADLNGVGERLFTQTVALHRRVKSIFVTHWDPTTTPAKRAFYQTQIARMEDAYASLIPVGTTIELFILGSNTTWGTAALRRFAGTDSSFIRDYSTKYIVSTACQTNDFGQVIPDNLVYGDPYTEQRGRGGGVAPKKAFAFITLSNCDVAVEEDLLPHETFHAVQWLNGWTVAKWPGSSHTYGLNAASWLTEGQAQHFGRLIAQDYGFSNFATESTRQFASNVGARWRTEYSYLNGYETTDTYLAGAVMYEYLASKYGIADTLKLQGQTNLYVPGLLSGNARYQPFERAFKATYGITVAQFMAEVRPYIEWSLVRGSM